MDKTKVIAAFEQQLRQSIESINQRQLELTASAQSEEEFGADRLASKQEEFMDESGINNTQASTFEDALLALNNIDKKKYDMVEPGALVETDSTNFLISTAMREVDVDGKTVVGISIQAPIYQAFEGKKVGDSVKFNDITLTIQNLS